jgi:hypothetical protein
MKAALIIILASMICGGCKRPADARMEEFSKSIRQTVNPKDLAAWAVKIISDTPRDRMFTDVSTNGAPKRIQELMTDFATLQVGMDGLSNDTVIIYTRGGGFGHWGFSVGAPTYTCGLGHTQAYWTNGIWFWTE